MAPKKPEPDIEALETFKAALRDKAPGRLYLFYGEEVYLREQYLKNLQALLLPPGAEAFNLKTLDGKICTVPDIAAACDCLPMLAEHTLVVVTDFDLYKAGEADRGALAALFEDLPDYLCLVFVYDLLPYKPDGRSKLAAALKRHGLAVQFARQAQSKLTNWIARRFKATGHDIDTRTAQYLIFRCGDLMHTLASEIGKVGAYAKNVRVTREDIDAVTTPQLDAVVFGLTDALGSRDYEGALTVLGDLLHLRESPQLLLITVTKHLRQLYSARVALESHRGQDDLVALWGMHPFPASKLLSAARKIDLAWCRRSLRLAADTDYAMKTSIDGEEALLTQLVLELAHG